MNRIGWLVLITLVATLFAPPTLAHASRAVLAASPETLGHVHFPISCSPAAQEQFDRALAMLHSFWFPQATQAFIVITRASELSGNREKAHGYYNDILMLTRGADSERVEIQRARAFVGTR